MIPAGKEEMMRLRPVVQVSIFALMVISLVGLAGPVAAPEPETDKRSARELAVFKTWLQKTHAGYGCDEGPARFQNAAVEAAYPGRRFYYVLTYARGIPTPYKHPLSLVTDIDAQGTVQRLDTSSLETYRRGLKRVVKTADARTAATAVLILTLGDPGQRRFPIKLELFRIKKTRDGWVCTYPHGFNYLSEVRFDRHGSLTAIHCMPPPVG
jgi:hypothetical protein